ncbi:MAG: hypothetical protein J7L38_08245 [Thermoproteales archaeon]|nr:hypothetical protein [Thermoproteales archaeon]
MGFSVTFSELIMIVASVVLASIVSSYALYTGSLVVSDLSQIMNEARRGMNIRVRIAYATLESGNFILYVKNVGSLTISDYTYLDVYIGEYGKARLYTYNANGGVGHFNITDSNGDGLWSPGETVKITVYPYQDENLNAPVFEAKIVLFRGVGDSTLFTKP